MGAQCTTACVEDNESMLVVSCFCFILFYFIYFFKDEGDILPFEGDYGHITCEQVGKGICEGLPSAFPARTGSEISDDTGGHRGKIYSLSFCAGSNVFCSGGQDGKILFFSPSGKRLFTVPLETSWVKAVTTSRDGKHVLAGTPDGPVLVTMHSSVAQFADSKFKRESIKIGEPGSTDAATSSVGVFPVKKFSGHESGINAVEFVYSNPGQFLTASSDFLAGLWDIESNSLLHFFKGHSGDATSLAQSKSRNNVVLTGSSDRMTKLWDINSAQCISTFSGHDADVTTVHMSGDGNLVATGSTDATILIYDLRNPSKILSKLSDNGVHHEVMSLRFSPKGYHVVAGYDEGTVLAWNLANELSTLIMRKTKKIAQLDFSDSGAFLAIGSHDGTTSVLCAEQ